MIPIYAKKIRNKWLCYSTFDCHDYSFDGDTIEEAKEKMSNQLTKVGLIEQALWMKEKIIEPDLYKQPDQWRPPHLDDQMV